MKLEHDKRAFNMSHQFAGSVSQLRLKTKLKLKHLRKTTEAYTEENFGHCPTNDKHFDRLMDEMSYWSDVAIKHFKDLWIEHIDAL